MRLSLLTVLVPVVAGFIIPDPKVAYQIVLDQAKDTQIGDNGKESTGEVNPLTKAFEDAKVGIGKNKEEAQSPWETFATGEWAGSSVRDNDGEWFGDMEKGRGNKDHRGGHDHHGDHHHHHHHHDGGHGKHPKHGYWDDIVDIDYHDYDGDHDGDHHHHDGDHHHRHHHGHHESSHHRQSLHDTLRHHGFYNDHDKYPHSQPHGDHGHDGLSGHHSYHSIPMPHHDGHYHSNSTLWDLVNSCPQTSIFASLAKKDTMFYNLLRDSHQNVTIFVPSNNAFKSLFKYGIIPEHGIDKDLLSKILNYHSVVGTHVREDLIHHNTIISRLQEDHLGKGMHQRLRLGLDQVHGPSVNFFADILLTDVVRSPHCQTNIA